jgi:acyl-CoA synthetase (AMP-forming)/AMP-acid ligase II
MPELVHQLAHAEVKVILCDETLEGAAREAVESMVKEGEAPIHPLIKVAPTGSPAHSWGDEAAADSSEYQVTVGPDDLADILYTSGTTGRPKGVAIRHRNAALIPGEANPSFSGKRWLHASPMFTFAGIGFIYNPMQLGLTGVYQPKFDAGRWLHAVEELQPTMCFIVPSMAQLIVAHPSFATADLTSIQLCAIGSAPLPPATLVAMQERMPEAAVSNSYGMTEAGPAFCAMPKGESLRRIGSVGQPMPPLEVRFVDDEGQEVDRGEVGEVAIRLEGR